MPELRRWQAEALPAVLEAASRRRRVIVSAVMGAGKSILMAELARRALPKTIERRQAIVVTAPRKNLVVQLASTFERWLAEHGVDAAVGQAHADLYQPHCHIVVSTAASYEKVLEDLRRQGRKVSLFIVDECFPAGTPVSMADGTMRAIEDVQEGDVVLSFSEAGGNIVASRVAATMSSLSEGPLVRFRAGNKTVVCTFAHPILTDAGWLPAGLLTTLHCVRTLEVQNGEDCRHNVHMVLAPDACLREAESGASVEGEDLLLRRAPPSCSGRGHQANDGHTRKPGAEFEADDGTKPDEKAGRQGEDGSHAAPNRTPAKDPWWKRTRPDSPAIDSVSHSACHLEDGSGDTNKTAARNRVSDGVQGGPGGRRSHAGGGDRWRKSLFSEAPASGCQKGRAAPFTRVDSVEVFEPRGFGEPGACKVYNLEVSGTHTYVASGVVVHNCHSSQADHLKAAIIATEPVCQVGFTATPMRSIRKERLELWDEVVYRYTMEDALRDGVLVPMRVVRQDGLENRPLDEACLEMIRSHTSGPGIVSARSIADAEAYAEWLRARGVGAEAIHSKLPQATQDERLRRLRARALDCLVHVSLLAEGVDFPWLRWICLRRKVSASVRFLQEIGRPMRAEPGKTECVVIDPHLLLGRFGLRPAEAIGQALELAAIENELADAQDQRERKPGEPTQEEAIAIEGLLAHLDDVAEWLRHQGVLNEQRMDGSAGWALADITHKQVEALGRAGRLTRHVPMKHRSALKALMHVPWALNRGEAMTLLGVLYAGAKWARAEGERRQLPDRVMWSLKWDEMPGDDLEEAMAKQVERGARRMQREIDKAAEVEKSLKVNTEALLIQQNVVP